MIRFSTIVSILFLLTGCAFGGGAPTATIVPLDKTATPRVSQVPPTATATPIPPPSPTPTATPVGVINVDAAATSAASALSTMPAAQVQVEVVSTALNVREGPGINYAVIKTARAGDIFAVTGVDSSGSWWQVDLAGRPGWLSAGADYSRLVSGSVAGVPTAHSDAQPAAAATKPADQQPPAAGRLIFATSSGGELYSVNLDGTDLRRLAGGVIDPVVSPDGRQVAFTRWDGAEFGALFTIGVDGRDERVVVGDIRQPKSPTWSPDGRQIVISFQYGGIRDPQPRCRYFEPGEKIRLPENIKILSTGLNGTRLRICFVRYEDLHWFLRQIDVASGRFEDLPSDTYSYSPTWDPQQPGRVVYSGEKGLMQFDVSGRQQQPLTTDLRDRQAVFSPDGTTLAITYKQHDHWEIYTFDLRSGERRRLTKPPILADPQYNSAAPAWSPDGQQLAFLTDRSGRWEIWVMNADGSNPRPLLPAEVQARLPLAYNGVNERLLNWIE